MSTLHQPDELADLKEHWRQWLAIVERLARRRGPVSPRDSRSYPLLYEALLAGCSTEAVAAEGARQAFLEQLADIVRPWLKAESLARTDPDILADLLRRCRDLDKALGVEQETSPRWSGIVKWAVVGMVTAVAAWSGSLLGRGVSKWAEEIWSGLRGICFEWMWLLLLATGVVILICFVTRPVRI